MGLFSFFAELLGFETSTSNNRERRVHERIPVTIMANFEQGGKSFTGRIINISQGGMKVEFENIDEIKIREPIYFVTLSDGQSLRVHFEHVWKLNNQLGLRVVDWESWLKYYFEITRAL